VIAQRLPVEPGGVDCGEIVHRDRVDPLRGHHAGAGARPVDLRHTEGRIVVARDVLGHLRHRGGLQPQVHLQPHPFGQRVHHRDRAQPPRGRMEPLHLPRGEIEGAEVAAEAGLHAGAQDLHRDRFQTAVGLADGGLVHLGDGRGRHRLAEAGIERVRLRAEAFANGAPRLLHREGRQPVLQPGERGGKVRADDVAARGEELAQLDVARPERGQRPGEPLGLPVLPARALETRRHPAEQARGPRRGHVLRHDMHAVPGQQHAGARQANEVHKPVDHARLIASRACLEAVNLLPRRTAI
jgi:hypothetical protein